MEKEVISFEKFNLPIKLRHLHMYAGGAYRGIHSHRAFEIVRVKSGLLNCFFDGEIIKVCRGQIIFINSNTGHSLYSDNAEITYINIDTMGLNENVGDGDFSLLHEFISHIRATPYLLINETEELSRLFDKTSAKYNDGTVGSYWYIKACIYEFIAFMYSRSFITPATVLDNRINKIGDIVRFVDENYKSPITLDDISEAVKYNKYTVCHTFKTITGATIFDYINFVRVHYAVDKLKEKSKSVMEIAMECGFSSATYFNRVFKSIYDCSPSVYRKLLTENNLS